MITAMEKDIVDFIRDENRELKADIKDMLGHAITGMSGKVRFEVDKIDLKIDAMNKSLKAHDERQNGIMQNHRMRIKKMETWKTRIVAAGSVITGLFTFLATLIISQWQHVRDLLK